METSSGRDRQLREAELITGARPGRDEEGGAKYGVNIPPRLSLSTHDNWSRPGKIVLGERKGECADWRSGCGLISSLCQFCFQ